MARVEAFFGRLRRVRWRLAYSAALGAAGAFLAHFGYSDPGFGGWPDPGFWLHLLQEALLAGAIGTVAYLFIGAVLDARKE